MTWAKNVNKPGVVAPETEKRLAPHPQSDPNWLSNFNQVLTRQSELRWAEDKARIRKLAHGMPEMRWTIRSMDDQELVDWFGSAFGIYSSNNVERLLYLRLRDTARDEILQRMQS